MYTSQIVTLGFLHVSANPCLPQHLCYFTSSAFWPTLMSFVHCLDIAELKDKLCISGIRVDSPDEMTT